MTEITQADRDAAENSSYTLEGCMCEQCLGEVAEQFARHRMEERAAIVAWLRSNSMNGKWKILAECIEAGEHLAKEDEK